MVWGLTCRSLDTSYPMQNHFRSLERMTGKWLIKKCDATNTCTSIILFCQTLSVERNSTACSELALNWQDPNRWNLNRNYCSTPTRTWLQTFPSSKFLGEWKTVPSKLHLNIIEMAKITRIPSPFSFFGFFSQEEAWEEAFYVTTEKFTKIH